MTLERYRDVAEELLITIWDLANPRVARDWMTKLEETVGTSLWLAFWLLALSGAAVGSVLTAWCAIGWVAAVTAVLLFFA